MTLKTHEIANVYYDRFKSEMGYANGAFQSNRITLSQYLLLRENAVNQWDKDVEALQALKSIDIEE